MQKAHLTLTEEGVDARRFTVKEGGLCYRYGGEQGGWLFSCLVVWLFSSCLRQASLRAERFGCLVVWWFIVVYLFGCLVVWWFCCIFH